jgi:DNA repair exonuclease SbcCD ATPase subunit
MFLENIKLKNFISCEDLNFNFPEGLIGIQGANGSGKSTIFRDAISYALYGISLRSKDLKDYIKRDFDFFNIELNFQISEKQYKIQ